MATGLSQSRKWQTLQRHLALLPGLCLLALAGCESRPPAAPSSRAASAGNGHLTFDRLLRRMRQRLDLMHDVARFKWNTQRPIQDVEREQALLKAVVERGQLRQLDADFTKAFFAAQIEAARLTQEADFQRWQIEKQGPFADVPDLMKLRQQIDQLNEDLLAALADARSFLETAEGQEDLDALVAEVFADVAAPVRDAAVRPLRRP
jgi:chorismate mutase